MAPQSANTLHDKLLLKNGASCSTDSRASDSEASIFSGLPEDDTLIRVPKVRLNCQEHICVRLEQAQHSGVGCLSQYRHRGPSGVPFELVTNYRYMSPKSVRSVHLEQADQSASSSSLPSSGWDGDLRSLELGITLENLGKSPVIVSELRIAQLYPELAGPHESNARLLESKLQSIGRLVVLPGEIAVISSFRIQSGDKGQLLEKLDFGLNSRSELDCVLRCAMDPVDVCRRISREPWTTEMTCEELA